MTTPPETPALDRRHLIRGGALLVGAAGAAAAVAAVPKPAHAADGDQLVVGAGNAATKTTVLTIGAEAGSGSPALSLVNRNGAALRLNKLPTNFEATLGIGELAADAYGLVVSGEGEDGRANTFVATGLDLAEVPVTFPLEATRLVDTRTAGGRESILRRSSGALDSQGRLKAGAWIDVAVAPDELPLLGVFANLTAVRPTRGGYLQAYRPGPRSPISSLNYQSGQTIANAAFVGLAVVSGFSAVRIYSSALTHVLLDLTGVVAPLGAAPASERSTPAASRVRRRAQRMRSVITRAR